MDAGLGDYSFLPFAAAVMVFLVLTVLFVPETKGRTLEEISREYGFGNGSDDQSRSPIA